MFFLTCFTASDPYHTRQPTTHRKNVSSGTFSNRLSTPGLASNCDPVINQVVLIHFNTNVLVFGSQTVGNKQSVFVSQLQSRFIKQHQNPLKRPYFSLYTVAPLTTRLMRTWRQIHKTNQTYPLMLR